MTLSLQVAPLNLAPSGTPTLDKLIDKLVPMLWLDLKHDYLDERHGSIEHLELYREADHGMPLIAYAKYHYPGALDPQLRRLTARCYPTTTTENLLALTEACCLDDFRFIKLGLAVPGDANHRQPQQLAGVSIAWHWFRRFLADCAPPFSTEFSQSFDRQPGGITMVRRTFENWWANCLSAPDSHSDQEACLLNLHTRSTDEPSQWHLHLNLLIRAPPGQPTSCPTN